MGMSIYKINSQIAECVIADEETGEVVEIDIDRIEQLEMLKADKIHNLALFYKNLCAEATAYKAEKDYLAKREKAATRQAESIKKYLSSALLGEPFKTSKVNITYRKSEAVVVDDIAKVDKQFLRYAEPTVDKTLIKKSIKSGVLVNGAHIEEKQNIQIK